MQQVRRARLRTGGFEWSLSRDIADPELWTERYHCPTWGDYLRQRGGMKQPDRELQILADAHSRAQFCSLKQTCIGGSKGPDIHDRRPVLSNSCSATSGSLIAAAGVSYDVMADARSWASMHALLNEAFA